MDFRIIRFGEQSSNFFLNFIKNKTNVQKLSTIHYPLSIIHYPLSIIHYPLSTIH